MRTTVKIFKALSDANRIRILKMLEIRALCVCEIAEVLQLANSTVSKHLSILRDVELIMDEREGKWVNYYLNKYSRDRHAGEILPMLSRWLTDDEQIRNDAKMVESVDRDIICGT